MSTPNRTIRTPQTRSGSRSGRTPRAGKAGAGVNSSRRSLWVAAFLCVWMLVIIGRLAWLQIIRHEHFVEKAKLYQRKDAPLLAARGPIVDREGNELAVSLVTDSLFVDLKLLKTAEERRRAAHLLSPLLEMGETDLLAKLAGNSSFVWLKRKLEPEKAQAIAEALQRNKLHGVAVRQEPVRFYPNDSLAAHLVGFVGAEEKGLAGIEQKHDEVLQGRSGEISWEKDASGRPFNRQVNPPAPGAKIVTTIDSVLQHKVEVLLDEAVRMTRARGAAAIVIDPATGEILALANLPTFNPNEQQKSVEDMARANRTIMMPFEPGSVFKLVTYAAAIEEGVAQAEDQLNCGNGEITIGRRVIHDTHAYAVLSVADAFAKSSNVGAIRLAQKIGKERLFEYIGRFGFGSRTGIELPGESRGIVNPLENWRPDSIGSVAIGQEISVTLLQAVAAMGAIANKGVWVRPHVIRRIAAPSGRVTYEARPESRQVVSPRTAEVMTGLLERVVTHGTARNAIHLTGYTAAGKTGTPQKADGVHGYKTGKFMPTFAGFVPATNPRFSIVVMVDEPQGLHQGGSVSAPIFNLIAEAALGDFAVQPDDKAFRQALSALSRKYEASASEDDRQQRNAEIQISRAEAETAPETKRAAEPGPAAGRGGAKGAGRDGKDGRDVQVSTNITRAAAGPAPSPPSKAPPGKETYLMPDFTGRGVRAVMQACTQLKLDVRLVGAGVAVRQHPAAGVRVRAGDPCKVEFQ
ncbi:MAG: penicillin-binding protein [Blastocatellia bacterium]